MKKLMLLPLVLFFILFQPPPIYSQDISTLHRNSYTPFELTRNTFGIYRDSKLINGMDFHPASSAATGDGLISLCIAAKMKWITKEDAEEKALSTLKAITGNNPNYSFTTNQSGYPLHWFEMDTGLPPTMWPEQYSTIDAAILTTGALFAKSCFCNNDSIGFFADLLWESVDWSKAIANPNTGGIYRLMEPSGEGDPNSVSLPFNEYMIVAWLAMNQAEGNPDSIATILWNNHYADASNLQTKNYQGIDLLTDNENYFLSSFVIQFAYYYCHYFDTNVNYLAFFSNAREADYLWWQTETIGEAYLWGNGAGHCYNPPYYCVAAINDNEEQIYSPHIIAGFIPVYSNGVTDLLNLINQGDAIYTLPSPNNNQILWRKSLVNPNWNSGEVQIVDFKTMLFGLTEHFEPGFFETYNNFFEEIPCDPVSKVFEINQLQNINVFPNPAFEEVSLMYEDSFYGIVQVVIWNNLGQQMVNSSIRKDQNLFKQSLSVKDYNAGIYYACIFEDGVLKACNEFVKFK